MNGRVLNIAALPGFWDWAEAQDLPESVVHALGQGVIALAPGAEQDLDPGLFDWLLEQYLAQQRLQASPEAQQASDAKAQ